MQANKGVNMELLLRWSQIQKEKKEHPERYKLCAYEYLDEFSPVIEQALSFKVVAVEATADKPKIKRKK